MKKLSDLILRFKPQFIVGDTDIDVSGITADSRLIKKGFVFVAVVGTANDGHKFIDIAIKSQATIIVCQNLPENINSDITYLVFEDTAMALAALATAYYNFPSEKIKLVGVTGTNGKTTIASLLYKLFNKLNYKTGLLSTVANYIDNERIDSTHTTPDAVSLNELLAKMVEKGCEYCFMEVSSHSVVQQRIAFLDFDGAIFTNLTHDHLDYHKDFVSYRNAKKLFFDNLKNDAFAISNYDDANGTYMLQNTKATKYYYSLRRPAEFKAILIENSINGLQLRIDNQEVHFLLRGNFNAYNLLAVYAASKLLNQDSLEVLSLMSGLSTVDGRFDIVENEKQVCAIVDYAHTPDALENVLKTILQIKTGNEQLIVVVGAGGDRDKTKRPIMASIAAKYADKLILTSDNPRTEDPNVIIDEMKKGLDEYEIRNTLVINDRREAIKTACMLSISKDIILVAGKGHETYQEINGVKHHFDDKEELIKFLKF